MSCGLPGFWLQKCSAFRKYLDPLQIYFFPSHCSLISLITALSTQSGGKNVSTPWLVSTCGKRNWLNMIWKGTHFSIEGLTADSGYQSINKTMSSKELPAGLRDRIVARYRSGEGDKYISAAMKIPEEHSGLHYSQMEEVPTKSWSPGQTEQSGEKGFSKRGDQEPDGHAEWAPEILCGDESSRRTTITAIKPRWVEGCRVAR